MEKNNAKYLTKEQFELYKKIQESKESTHENKKEYNHQRLRAYFFGFGALAFSAMAYGFSKLNNQELDFLTILNGVFAIPYTWGFISSIKEKNIIKKDFEISKTTLNGLIQKYNLEYGDEIKE